MFRLIKNGDYNSRKKEFSLLKSIKSESQFPMQISVDLEWEIIREVSILKSEWGRNVVRLSATIEWSKLMKPDQRRQKLKGGRGWQSSRGEEAMSIYLIAIGRSGRSIYKRRPTRYVDVTRRFFDTMDYGLHYLEDSLLVTVTWN